MKIFVIRHGIADGRAATDAERRLTPEGRERFGLEVRGLQRLGVQLDTVWHSPLARAVETAEMLEPLLRGRREVLEALADEPDGALLEALERGGEHTALVGHEPWQSQLVSWLVTGDPRRGPAFHLPKGAVVRLEGRPLPGQAQLSGFWGPKLLAALGRE